jgi:hypothetical protein
MTTHRYAPFTALLVLALLCLLPSALLARPRSHTKTVTSSHSKRVSTREPLQRRSVKEVSRRHRSPAATLSVVRSRSRHRSVAKFRRTAASEPRHAIPAPLVIKARVAPESQETGVSHPPDLDDIGPSSRAVPVVNVLRRSERPQLAPIDELADTTEILPSLYNKRGRLIMPPPLKGSREILLHQNEVAERDGLERIQDDNDLERMRRLNMLVSLPVNAGLQVDERLPANRRYSRPWTAQFLTTMARAHYARFHTALQVNSAVRTVEFQQKLIRVNGNAAPARGETASPHLTGQAVDLAKHGLSLSEIAWMRGYLLPLVQEGKIDVEEEFQQACFHISVYRKYLPPSSVPRRSIASTHRESTADLAIAIP